MTDQSEPSSEELALREQLYNAMDGNLRMSRRRELLAAYRAAIRAAAGQPAPPEVGDLREQIAEAIARHDYEIGLASNETPRSHHISQADAVMPVVRVAVDGETAELRAEIERLRGSVAHHQDRADKLGRQVAAVRRERHAAESSRDRLRLELKSARGRASGHWEAATWVRDERDAAETAARVAALTEAADELDEDARRLNHPVKSPTLNGAAYLIRARAAAEAQPATTTTPADEGEGTCTCGIAGSAFVPVYHYSDCPAYQSLHCSLAMLNRPHDAHLWEPQPGMTPLHCSGRSPWPTTATPAAPAGGEEQR